MDAFHLRYMRRIRFTLRFNGAWPDHVFDDALATKLPAVLSRYGYTCFLGTLCSCALVFQILYLIKNMETERFIDLGQTYLTILMSILYIQRILLPTQTAYQMGIKEFVSKFNLIHHKDETEFSAKMYEKVTKFCEIAVTIQHIQIFMSVVTFNLVPILNNLRTGMYSSEKPINGTYEQAVTYLLPFDTNSEIGYTIVCLYNWYASSSMGCIFLSHDFLVYVLVFHIWGHMKILEHNLNSFPRPRIAVNAKAVPMRYSNEECKEVAMNLKDIINRYLLIKNFVANTSDAYSVTLYVYYGFHLVADCVLLLECSTMEIEALAKYGILTVCIYQQLIQLSVVFELVTSKSDSLVDAVYHLPWEYMDTRNRRTVLILLQIVQQSLSVKACGMVPVGVQTMLAILKGSFSYFLMLRTFATK